MISYSYKTTIRVQAAQMRLYWRPKMPQVISERHFFESARGIYARMSVRTNNL